MMFSVLGGPGQQQTAAENIFHPRRTGIDHPKLAFLNSSFAGRVKALAVGAHIHIEEGDLTVRVMFTG